MVRYDAMCRAIQEAYDVDEVKDMRDKAMALQAYARQAQNVEMERQACEIRLRAERRVGQLLKVMDKAKGGGDRQSAEHPSKDCRGANETIADLGISYNQSSQWQKLAELDEEVFEQAVKEDRPTTGGIIAKVEAPREPKKNAVGPPALWFWGRLLDIERDNILDLDPNDLVADMLPHMQVTTRTLALTGVRSARPLARVSSIALLAAASPLASGPPVSSSYRCAVDVDIPASSKASVFNFPPVGS